MGTNCAPLLADLFLYSYENEFLDNIIRNGHRGLARSFNLCYRFTDDLIVFNNNKLRKLTNQITLQTTLISHSSCQPDYTTNVMILTSTMSIFHFFPATYHLALLIVHIFRSSKDMHEAAHTVMMSDIATIAWLIDFCHKTI